MADLVERARKHLGRPETRQLMNELADRIAALEAEAFKGERRGLERAAQVADAIASQWVLDASNAKTVDARSYFENRHSAASWVCDRILALVPEAPVREAE